MKRPDAEQTDDPGLSAAAARLGSGDHPVLLRLPISHYCRKAEWGLTIAGIEYANLNVDFPGMRQVKRANPVQRTVPVLVDGPRLVQGSHAILRWCDEHRSGNAPSFYPTEHARRLVAWEEWMDEEVGPVVRRLAYRVLARKPSLYARTRRRQIVMRLQRPVYRAVARYLKIREHAKEDDAAVPGIVDKVADRLKEADTGYLFISWPTGADVATAALLEPLLPVAKVWELDERPGWEDVQAFILRVRPGKRRVVADRKVKEKDWQALERLNQAHGHLERPTAADYA